MHVRIAWLTTSHSFTARKYPAQQQFLFVDKIYPLHRVELVVAPNNKSVTLRIGENKKVTCNGNIFQGPHTHTIQETDGATRLTISESTFELTTEKIAFCFHPNAKDNEDLKTELGKIGTLFHVAQRSLIGQSIYIPLSEQSPLLHKKCKITIVIFIQNPLR